MLDRLPSILVCLNTALVRPGLPGRTFRLEDALGWKKCQERRQLYQSPTKLLFDGRETAVYAVLTVSVVTIYISI